MSQQDNTVIFSRLTTVTLYRSFLKSQNAAARVLSKSSWITSLFVKELKLKWLFFVINVYMFCYVLLLVSTEVGHEWTWIGKHESHHHHKLHHQDEPFKVMTHIVTALSAKIITVWFFFFFLCSTLFWAKIHLMLFHDKLLRPLR